MSRAFKEFDDIKIEWRPCPFCGNLPEWVLVPGDDYIVRCSVCHASTKKARWTPEEAAADWNIQEIENDHFAITEDIKIDEYLLPGIKKILFSEYSNVEDFPCVENGFLCSSAVIVAENITLAIETEGNHLLYDEISGYGYDYYSRPIADTGTEIQFVKSMWRNNRLRSLTFLCGNKTVTISTSAKEDCMVVSEEGWRK